MKLIWKEVSYEVLFYSFLMYSIWVLTDLQKKLFVVVPLLTHIWFYTFYLKQKTVFCCWRDGTLGY